MKFNVGDHLQEIDSIANGIVTSYDFGTFHWNKEEPWYLIENDELGLVNHWVTESKFRSDGFSANDVFPNNTFAACFV